MHASASTISTQFHPFTTKNMGATGPIKSCSNSGDLRTESASGDEGHSWLDKARSGCIHEEN